MDIAKLILIILFKNETSRNKNKNILFLYKLINLQEKANI